MNDDHPGSRSVVFTAQAFIGSDTDFIQKVLSDPRTDQAATLLAKLADLSIFMTSIGGDVVSYFVDANGCEIFAIDPDLGPGPTRPNKVSRSAPTVVVLADAIGSRLLVVSASHKESRHINEVESDHPILVTDLLGRDDLAASLRSLGVKLEAAGIKPRLVAAFRREGFCRNMTPDRGNFHIVVTLTIAVADVLSSSAIESALPRAARSAIGSALVGALVGRQSTNLRERSSLSAHLTEHCFDAKGDLSTSVEFSCLEDLLSSLLGSVLWGAVGFRLVAPRLNRVESCGRLAPNDVFPASSVVGAYLSAGRWSELGYAKPARGGGWTFDAGSLPLDWAEDYIAVNHARGLKLGAETFAYSGTRH